MSDGTKIEWTDVSWNPITGNGQVRLNEQWLDQPLRWKRPRKIFVCAHGDLFHESVPDEWIDEVFAVMALAPQHTFQLLTKRAARMRQYIQSRSLLDENGNATEDIRINMTARVATPSRRKSAPALTKIPLSQFCVRIPWPLPNVWLGVSVEDQQRADERIPELMETPAAIRWISAEPLLGGIDLNQIDLGAWLRTYTNKPPHEYDPVMRYPLLQPFWHMLSGYSSPGIDWVVAGGESGPGARPMHPDWARSLRDQCAAAGVPFFFKQWGEYGTNAFLMSTGEPIFRQFKSFDEWVNKASTWVRGGICLDTQGRQLNRGADFMRSRDDGTFPVTIMHEIGKRAAGRLLDGVLHDAMPGSV